MAKKKNDAPVRSLRALENLAPATRLEKILDGDDITPATRDEYFIKKAMSSGGSTLPEYTSADAGKALSVNSAGNGVEWANIGGYDAVISLTFDEDGIVDGGEYVSGGYNSIISAIRSGKIPNVFVYGDYDDIFFTLASTFNYRHTIEDDTMIIEDLAVRAFDCTGYASNVATAEGGVITGAVSGLVGKCYILLLGSDNSITLD